MAYIIYIYISIFFKICIYYKPKEKLAAISEKNKRLFSKNPKTFNGIENKLCTHFLIEATNGMAAELVNRLRVPSWFPTGDSVNSYR